MTIIKRIKDLGKEKVTLTNKMRNITLKIRPYLTEEYLKDTLFDFDKLVIESKQEDMGTHVLVYDVSNKYHLIVIVSVNGNIRIVSAWKTNKGFEKLLKRYGGFWYFKKI